MFKTADDFSRAMSGLTMYPEVNYSLQSLLQLFDLTQATAQQVALWLLPLPLMLLLSSSDSRTNCKIIALQGKRVLYGAYVVQSHTQRELVSGNAVAALEPALAGRLNTCGISHINQLVQFSWLYILSVLQSCRKRGRRFPSSLQRGPDIPPGARCRCPNC